jgi:hypothetical protein
MATKAKSTKPTVQTMKIGDEVYTIRVDNEYRLVIERNGLSLVDIYDDAVYDEAHHRTTKAVVVIYSGEDIKGVYTNSKVTGI